MEIHSNGEKSLKLKQRWASVARARWSAVQPLGGAWSTRKERRRNRETHGGEGPVGRGKTKVRRNREPAIIHPKGYKASDDTRGPILSCHQILGDIT